MLKSDQCNKFKFPQGICTILTRNYAHILFRYKWGGGAYNWIMVISIYTPFPGRPCSFVATFTLFETHALLVLSALLWTFRSHDVRRSLDSSHSLSDLLDFLFLLPSAPSLAPIVLLWSCFPESCAHSTLCCTLLLWALLPTGRQWIPPLPTSTHDKPVTQFCHQEGR